VGKKDNQDLLHFLEPFPPVSQAIALWLRDWVWDLYPKCNELIYDNYNFLAFGWAPTDKMGDVFCSIAVGTRGVIFGFTHGVDLHDPENMLSGGGNQFRSLRVPDADSFPTAYVQMLMKQAFDLCIARMKDRSQAPNGQTIVKSISPTKRRPGMQPKAAAARKERHKMPDEIMQTLKNARLFDAYSARPPYQQNDYIEWITSAKRSETQAARLERMLDELRQGDVYMKMPYRSRAIR